MEIILTVLVCFIVPMFASKFLTKRKVVGETTVNYQTWTYISERRTKIPVKVLFITDMIGRRSLRMMPDEPIIDPFRMKDYFTQTYYEWLELGGKLPEGVIKRK